MIVISLLNVIGQIDSNENARFDLTAVYFTYPFIPQK